MKITQITLESFRSFLQTKINTDAKVVYFAGMNAAGKTSIREGLKWVLMGRCDVTDGKGSGAEDLIPSGHRDVSASVFVATIGAVSRAFTPSGGSAFSVEEFTGTSQIQQQALYTKLNTSPAFLAAVLDTETFLRMHHAEAKALVLSLLNVKVIVDKKSYTLDELDMRYKQAFEDRKSAKHNLQRFHRPDPPAKIDMPTMEAIDTQLKKLRKDLGAAQQGIGAVLGSKRSYEQELSRLDLSPIVPEDLTAEIADLEERLGIMEAEAVPDPPKTMLDSDPEKLKFLRSRREALDRHDPKGGCVIDGDVRCRTARSEFKSRVDFLATDIDRLSSAVVDIPSAPPAQSPLTKLRSSLEDLKLRESRYQDRVERKENDVHRAAELRTALNELPKTETQEQAILTLEIRIGKGETLLQDARAHWAAIEGHEKADAEYVRLGADVARLEMLCDLLGPTGLRVQALNEAMGAFEAAINHYLVPWRFIVAIDADAWVVLVNGRPFQTYSRSERWRIGMAIQLAIAGLSGLRFAVLDEVDMLDVDVSNDLTAMLLSEDLDLDQVFVLATRDTHLSLPKAPGLLAYRLTSVEGLSQITETVGV